MKNTVDLKYTSLSINILYLAMVYITLCLTSDIFAYNSVSLGITLLPDAPLLIPLSYIILAIITEVYGYVAAKKVIWITLLCEFFFAILIKILIKFPPSVFCNPSFLYNENLDPDKWFITTTLISVSLSSFINIYLIAKWKIFFKGKLFWLRCFAASAIGSFILVIVTIFFGYDGKENYLKLSHLVTEEYSHEIFYSFFAVWPASIINNFLKLSEQLEIYDNNTNFNPFR